VDLLGKPEVVDRAFGRERRNAASVRDGIGAGPRQRVAMKVLRIITRLNIGGPAIHSVLLMRGLSARGYDTTLVTGYCEPSDGDMSYLLQPGDPVRWIPEMSRSVRPWNNLRALWKLWRLMRSERPMIVHTHTAMAGSLGRVAAILGRVPVIIHTFHGNSLRHYFSPLMSGVFLRIERLLARHTDAICVVSRQQVDELSGEFGIAPREKFRVVPLGLDLDAYLSLPMPVSDGSLNVGWIGRLVPVKNVPLLIEAIERTLKGSDHIRFFIAGDGPESDAVKAAVSRFPGRVEWLGWQQDVSPVIAKCHVLIQTSLNEGTPVAIIQGMAAGRPFLSTAVGGLVDMVEGPELSNGNGCRWFGNGILADAQPEAFASALVRLAEKRDLLADMGRNARDFAARRYRPEALLDNLDHLYREIINRKLAIELK